ncbi:MAG: 3-isopropylmalate dehydratase small subunit [Acidimicrobiaceae bacterium]|nr:3-isopropylmalate dehydratase small subunit [Acidimicrobiaceae bacterium]
MEPVSIIKGSAYPLPRSNIDTDQILPAKWMKRVERTGYENGLFEIWRQDPSFITNDPERSQASIIVAGENFGCGSSRQHAVWALRDFGIRAIISSSIADIHRGNLPQEGIVPIELAQDVVELLLAATGVNPRVEIEINVTDRTVTCAEAGVFAMPFRIDNVSHFNLIHGYDPIDVTLTFEKSIETHESSRDPWLPQCSPEFV